MKFQTFCIRYCWIGIVAALTLYGTPTLSAETRTAPAVDDVFTGLSSGPLRNARLVSLPQGVLVRSGRIRITQKDVDAEFNKAPSELQRQLRTHLFFMVENRFADSVLRWEAAAWAQKRPNVPKDETGRLRAFLDDLTRSVAVSDADLRAFYDRNREMMGDTSFEQVKPNLRDVVLQQKRSDVIQRRLDSISDRYEVEVDRSWAQRQYTASLNNPVDKARRSGLPSMVNFGSDGCRPCDMMTPIREAIKAEYAGKLNVVFVHVRQEQVLAARYGIQSIPVQVLFDKNGREVYRHVGFWPKEQITAQLARMGVK